MSQETASLYRDSLERVEFAELAERTSSTVVATCPIQGNVASQHADRDYVVWVTPDSAIYQGSSNSPAFAPATNASHSDSVNTSTVSDGPVNFELRIAM